MRHICLSAQIAAPLIAAGAANVAVAPRPDEAVHCSARSAFDIGAVAPFALCPCGRVGPESRICEWQTSARRRKRRNNRRRKRRKMRSPSRRGQARGADHRPDRRRSAAAGRAGKRRGRRCRQARELVDAVAGHCRRRRRGACRAVPVGLWRGGFLPIAVAGSGGLTDKVAALEKQVGELQSPPAVAGSRQSSRRLPSASTRSRRRSPSFQPPTQTSPTSSPPPTRR